MKHRLSPWSYPAPTDRWIVCAGLDGPSPRRIYARTKRQALRHLRRLSAAGVWCYAEDRARMRDWPQRRRCWLLADGRRWDGRREPKSRRRREPKSRRGRG